MNTPSRLLLAALLMIFSRGLDAQNSSLLLFSDHFSLNASRFAPAAYGNDEGRFSFSLPYIYAYAGNSAIDRGLFFSAMRTGKISEAEMNATVDDLKERNYISTGTEISPFSAGYTLATGGVERVSFTAGITQQAYAKVIFSNDLANLAWYGNKSTAGKVIDLGPFAATALMRREYYLGASAPVWKKGELSLRAGVRAKLLRGYAAGHLEDANALFYTSEDGDQISVSTSFTGRTAGMEDFNPFETTGRGFGMDLGVTARYGTRWTVDASIIDLGKMRFDEQVVSYIADPQTVNFEGVEIVNGEVDENGLDSMFSEFDVRTEEGGEFTLKNSTRLVLRGSYSFQQFDEHQGWYPAHTITATYEQGFAELDRSSLHPAFGLAYTYDLKGILQVGSSMTYQLHQFNIGAFASVAGGPFRFGLASSNLSGLVFGGHGLGTDVSMAMEFHF
jgi:hypothetical protein